MHHPPTLVVVVVAKVSRIHADGKGMTCNKGTVEEACTTHPHVADVFLVAYGLVGLVDGWRTLGATPVAKARVPATVVVPALIAVAQGATGCAARALETRRDERHRHCWAVYNGGYGTETCVQLCGTCVYRILDRFFLFPPPSFLSVFLFFFLFPGRREIRLCVRARWMRLHRFEKENSHCENAFNVYIGFQRLYCPRYRFSDLSKSSPE